MKSKILGLEFRLYNNGLIVFEDGVVYKEHEWRELKGLGPEEIKRIHETKKIIGGEIISRENELINEALDKF